MKIYVITNLANGKQYVGQTSRPLEKRFDGHVKAPAGESAIHDAIAKYGVENFRQEELATAGDQAALDMLEKFFIDKLNTMAPNGYNLKGGGQNGGSQYSEESRQKMSSAKLGSTVPAETRAKMSESHKKFWANNEDAYAKRSQQSKDAWKDPEYRETMSKIRTEYWSDPENRARMAEQAKEFTTEEQKAKISDAVKAAYDRPEVRAKLQAHIDTRKKKVIDNNGNVYNSIKEAAAIVGCKSSSIIRVLKGAYKTAGGLTWKYVDEA